MFSKKTMIQAAVSVLVGFATMPVAQAQTAPSEPSTAPAATAPVAPARPNAFKQCAAENNITLPVRGSGQKLSDADRTTLRGCVRTARKVAWKTCAEGAGFTPAAGVKPSLEQRHEIRACLAKAGFHHHGRGFQQQQQPQPAAASN